MLHQWPPHLSMLLIYPTFKWTKSPLTFPSPVLFTLPQPPQQPSLPHPIPNTPLRQDSGLLLHIPKPLVRINEYILEEKMSQYCLVTSRPNHNARGSERDVEVWRERWKRRDIMKQHRCRHSEKYPGAQVKVRRPLPRSLECIQSTRRKRSLRSLWNNTSTNIEKRKREMCH